MKRLFAWILTLALLFSCIPVFSEDFHEVPVTGIWTGENNNQLQLNEDGSGILTVPNIDPINGEWSRTKNDITFTYNMYGQRTLMLVLEEVDGAYQLTGSEGAHFYSKERLEQIRAEEQAADKAYGLAWKEEIQLGFVTIKLNKCQQYREINGSSGIGYVEPDTNGIKYFAAVGTIKNNSGAAMNRNAIAVKMVFDDQNAYDGKVYVDYNGSLVQDLPASGSGTLYVYAALPLNIAKSFKTAEIRFGFNERFKSNPSSPSGADYEFLLNVDNTMATESRKEPARVKSYYSESPSLPVPTSYCDVTQSGHSSSSTNGKTTSIIYRYRLQYKNDSGKTVFAKYISGLKSDNYTVKKSGSDYVISNGDTKLATVSFDESQLKVDIKPGNEKLKTKPTASKTTTKKAKTYKVGDTLKTSYAQIKLSKAGKANKIYSYDALKKTPSRWHYYYADTGNTLVYVRGTFKNLGSQAVDIRNVYAQFTIDGNEYTCTVDAMMKNGQDFEHNVPAKGTLACYIFAEVPSSVAKSYKKCTLKIGLNKNFGIKVTKNGSYQFDLCDNVFTVKIK